MTGMDPKRCVAAHAEDPALCAGPKDAVVVLDQHGNKATGCELHAARLYASLIEPRVEPGSVPGAATRVAKAAQELQPFPWRNR